MLASALFGALFGFAGSMPIAGPIAVLVLARGVERRFRSAMAIAIGSAVPEAVYAFLACIGVSAFFSRYPFIVPVARGVAALILIVLGVIFLRRKAREAQPSGTRRGGWGGGLLLGFGVTALNPTLIVTWTAAATTLFSTGLVRFTPEMAVPFATGAALGIVGWFSLLLLLVRRFQHRLSGRLVQRLLRAMGVLLLGIGLWLAVETGRSLVKGVV